jgi:hypothetical protein
MVRGKLFWKEKPKQAMNDFVKEIIKVMLDRGEVVSFIACHKDYEETIKELGYKTVVVSVNKNAIIVGED